MTETYPSVNSLPAHEALRLEAFLACVGEGA
jgi:hypothetical protein